MRRYQYKLNDQNTTKGGWGRLQPLKYIEVAGGDTISGTISVHNRSAKTVEEIKSRAYCDLYAFYVPYRVVWPDWAQFVTGQNEDLKLPAMSHTREWNFEKSKEGGNSLLGLAYFACWERFFITNATRGAGSKAQASEPIAVRAADFEANSNAADGPKRVYKRPTTFDTKMLDADHAVKPTNWLSMDLTDEEGRPATTVNRLRQALTEERFQKAREYYGGRYVDFLAATGIKANWNILDEPECIGVSNNDWQYKKVKGTGEGNLAQVSGYFEGANTLKLRKTFCPEHGLIVVVGAVRADLFNMQQGSHIVCHKNHRTDFWSPEYMHLGDRLVPEKTVSRGYGPAEVPSLYTPHFEEYRCGRSENTGNSDYVFSISNGIVSKDTLSDTAPPASAFEAEPTGYTVEEDGAEPTVVYGSDVPWFTEVRATRVSSVPPRKPVGVA